MSRLLFKNNFNKKIIKIFVMFLLFFFMSCPLSNIDNKITQGYQSNYELFKGQVMNFNIDFEAQSTGTCTEQSLKAAWGDGILISSGVKEGRVSIVNDATQGKVLRILYPKGKYKSENSGAQWKGYLGKTYNELYCSYKVKFQSGFQFVLGGKMPGLAGGQANSGGHPSNGYDGFSARMMWREGAKASQYVYHVNQAGNDGDLFFWMISSSNVIFNPDQWYTLEHRIVMNSPNSFNGKIECWIDGQLALTVNNISFRKIKELGIDIFYFSTFFGGSSSDWASPKDQYVYFDDFVISESKITH